ncbi:MAG: MalY/PatB family protein [Acidimicrobiales bacterium]
MQIEPLELDQLRRLTGVKWTRDGDGVLPAWVADMDIRPPACVIDALTDLVGRGDLGYSWRPQHLLPEVFAAWQKERHGWSPDPGDVRPFCDVLHAIDVALWLLTEPGDGVVLLTPIYPPFIRAVSGSGRRIVEVPLDPDGWRLDPERLRAAIDDGTRALLICNPHNPTGRVFDDDELEAIARVAVEHDLLLLSDEVWADLLHPGAVHRPMALVGDDVAARTITITSASKAFNLAGLRCAVAHVGHHPLADAIAELPSHVLGAVGTPGAEAAVAAWSEGGPWLAALRTHLTQRRDQLARRLADDLPGVGWQLPESTYLAWLDLGAYGLGDDPGAELLRRASVSLSSGPTFGSQGDGFVRLNYATSAEILDLIVDRLVDALAGTDR